PFGDQVDVLLTGLEQYGYAGSVLVAEDGHITLNEGYGLANREHSRPNAADTVYDIGSITKLFTQTAILKMEMEGLLKTEDPISQYLVETPPDKADITIQQILEMRGGFAEYHDDTGDFQLMTRDQALRRILNTPLVAVPGTEDLYSNSGYTLLAILIEVVSGKSYQDYVRQTILEPLGMESTGFVGEDLPNLAYTRNSYDGYGTPAGWPYSWVLVGNGGMVATTEDLYRFAQAVIGDEFLSEAVKAKSVFASGYGLAAGGGSDTDFSAAIFYDVTSGSVFVSLSNQVLYSGEAVALTLYDMLDGADVPVPPDVVDSAVEPNSVAGTYIRDGDTLQVSAEGEGVRVDATSQAGIDVLLGSEDDELVALSELTLQIQADIRAGDYTLMQAALGGDLSLEQVQAEEGAFWERLVSNNGAFQSIDILGTAPSDSLYSFSTTFRLNFEQGSVYIRWVWEDGTIADIRVSNEPLMGYSLTFLPTGEQTFAAYRLGEPYLTTLTFDAVGNLTVSARDKEAQFEKMG
ncbi:MAG: beta-lactamase family protein, partial [Anaerolineae bacterium]